MEDKNHSHHYIDTVVLPTCKGPGYTLHQCACGYSYRDKYTPAGEHLFEETAPIAPTCTQNGGQELHCTVCGYSEIRLIPALGHDWAQWRIKAVPGCLETGTRIRSCSRCDVSEEQTIPAMGHKLTRPHCSETKKGIVEYFCENCGQTVCQKSNGHGYKGWLVAAAIAMVTAMVALVLLLVLSKDTGVTNPTSNQQFAQTVATTEVDMPKTPTLIEGSEVDTTIEINETQVPTLESVKVINADDIPDEMISLNAKYQVAFVTDVGDLKDKAFNEGTYDGVKLYANANGKTYKYYQPANGDAATDEDRIAAMKLACENGAEVVVAAGFMQELALKTAAKAYPDVNFIFIDGYPIGCDNVAGIGFQEEQAGYLAGYAAVMEGYTKLGFCGGGNGTNPSCQRYGYGFVQGVNAAAAKKGIIAEVNYSWLHGAAFSASSELYTMATGWYQTGTEIIFACGGSMFTSVDAAASATGGKVVGVDVDQSYQSANVVTSAMKDLANATQWAIAKHYDGTFSEIGGVSTALGANDNAVCLPTASWSLENWSVEEYKALFAAIVDGKIKISTELVKFPGSTEYVTVIPVQ